MDGWSYHSLASHFNAKHYTKKNIVAGENSMEGKYVRAYKRAKKLVSISEYTARRVKEEFPGEYRRESFRGVIETVQSK